MVPIEVQGSFLYALRIIIVPMFAFIIINDPIKLIIVFYIVVIPVTVIPMIIIAIFVVVFIVVVMPSISVMVVVSIVMRVSLMVVVAFSMVMPMIMTVPMAVVVVVVHVIVYLFQYLVNRRHWEGITFVVAVGRRSIISNPVVNPMENVTYNFDGSIEVLSRAVSLMLTVYDSLRAH